MEATTTAAVKSPPEETSPELDRPSRIQKTPLSFTNGVLKLRPPTFSLPLIPHAPPDSGGAYRECLKNHAAAMGGHAVDGCGEFMPPSSLSTTSSLLCAACGCHRNFHRKTSENTQMTEYQPLHRHLPPAPPPDSPSPPPISSSLYPSSAPTAHMLLALSNNTNQNNNKQINNQNNNNLNTNNLNSSSASARRRFRTRFTQAQKDKMFEFAEKLAWKMQRKDEDMINAFCNSIGVEKGVFKVWMHNNKNTLGKRDSTVNNNIISNDNNDIDHHRNSNLLHHHRERNGEEEVSGANRVVVGTNGSSSSS